MPRRMQGSPWHIGYVKANDDRRHRSRCIYFIPKHGCQLIGNCCGSSHCSKYKKSLHEKRATKIKNTSETYQPKTKSATHLIKNKVNKNKSVKQNIKGIKVGDTVELLDPIDNFKMKVSIVKKEKVCLEESKISEDSPVGKAVIGKQKGDQVEIFTNEKIVYQIIGWTKQ